MKLFSYSLCPSPGKILAVLAPVGLGLLVQTQSLVAQTQTWIGGTGDWAVPGNWSPAGMPTAASLNNINGEAVTVSTAGAASSRLAIGKTGGPASLFVSSSGELTTGLSWIGDNSTSLGGLVTVEGVWNNISLITVANSAPNGSLVIQNGGIVNAGSIVAAIRPTNTANITVTGAGSQLNVTGSTDAAYPFVPGIGLTLGYHPSGAQGNTATLLVKDGGAVKVTNSTPGGTDAIWLGNAATVQIGAGGAPGTINADFIETGASGQVIFNHSSPAYTFNTPIHEYGRIIHNGSGKTTLTGSSNDEFYGTTTVNSGTLINNSTLGGNTVVNAGGHLGGSGTFLGSILINAGGTFSPGSSPGTVTIDGDLTNNGILDIEFGGGSQDRFIIGGNLILGPDSILNLVRLPGSLPAVLQSPFVIDGDLVFLGGLNLLDNFGLNAGEQFSLFSVRDPVNAGSFFDVFVELDLNGGLVLGSDNAAYAATLTAVRVTVPVPEPSTYGLAAAGLLIFAVARSRRAAKKQR